MRYINVIGFIYKPMLCYYSYIMQQLYRRIDLIELPLTKNILRNFKCDIIALSKTLFLHFFFAGVMPFLFFRIVWILLSNFLVDSAVSFKESQFILSMYLICFYLIYLKRSSVLPFLHCLMVYPIYKYIYCQTFDGPTGPFHHVQAGPSYPVTRF